MRLPIDTWLFAAAAAGTLALCAPGCGAAAGDGESSAGGPGGAGGAGVTATTGTSAGTGAGTGSEGQGAGPLGPTQPTCTNLECKQVECGGGKTTRVTGTVHDPSGKIPLYNVVTYVPNGEVKPLPEGASCDQCGSTLSGDPLVVAITDTKGSFVLENVPAGENIPLVVQVGKWRRQVVLPKVEPCEDNAITDADALRLPRSTSEGDIPRIALTTGSADALECLLYKLGLEESVFSNGSGEGRVHFYRGNGTGRFRSDYAGGAEFSSAQDFWSSAENLLAYDVVLLSCEGSQNTGTKPMSSRQALVDYTEKGGRVFASHWHNVWIDKGAGAFPSTAEFDYESSPKSPFKTLIDTSFPKGEALADWLFNVGGSPVKGELEIMGARRTVMKENNPPSQRWIYSNSPECVQYYSFNTPVGAADEAQCGRVVFSDMHVSSGDESGSTTRFPEGCTTTELSPQEKALLFMLFDLSACIQPDEKPPAPPTLK